MTVADYRGEFTRLERYAPGVCPDEAERARRFHEGLRRELYVPTTSTIYQSLSDAVDAATILERALTLPDEPVQAQQGKRRSDQTGSHAEQEGQRRQHQGESSRQGSRDSRRDRPSSQQTQTRHTGSSGRYRGRHSSVQCRQCRRWGHFRRDCPQLTGAASQSVTGPPQRYQQQQSRQTQSHQQSHHQQTQQAPPPHSQQYAAVSQLQPQQLGYQQPAPTYYHPQMEQTPLQHARPIPAVPLQQRGPQAQRGRGGGRGRGRGQGGAYALAETSEIPDHSVIRGTIAVYGSYARILVDCGASHSFIATRFCRASGLRTEFMPSSLHVSTPISGVVELREVCRACTLTIAGYDFVFDLILLDMSDFDIIVGMDWLIAFRAKIDCYHRRVTFRLPGGETLKFTGDSRWSPTLPPMQSLLATLWAEGADDTVRELPHVVRDYADVFPDELPGLPPVREVEFTIDLLPGTTPIVTPSYRMAPAELTELQK